LLTVINSVNSGSANLSLDMFPCILTLSLA